VVTKQSIYLDSNALAAWDLVSRDERNHIINKALADYAESLDGGVNLRDIRKLELDIQDMKDQIATIQKTIEVKNIRLNELRGGKTMRNIDLDKDWLDLERCARRALESGEVWQSHAGRADYRVHKAGMGRIYLENIKTGRTTSNFQKGTFVLGMQRLLDAGGRIKRLNMIPVKMHEYAVVHLHPKLSIQDDYIVYEGAE